MHTLFFLLMVYRDICSIYCSMLAQLHLLCHSSHIEIFQLWNWTPLDLLDQDSFDSRTRQILNLNLVHSMFLKTADFCWFTFIRAYFNECKMKQRHIGPKWGIIIFFSKKKNNDMNIYVPVYTVCMYVYMYNFVCMYVYIYAYISAAL